jgi:hypothetical protein
MNLVEILCRAIDCRQAERMDKGEPAMEEMWLHPFTYDSVISEATKYESPRERVAPEFYGVKLRRIGDV